MWCWGRVKCAAAKAIWQAKGACAIENAVLVGCACGGVCKTRITCITRKTRISSIHAGCRVKMPRKPHKYCLPRFSLPCFSLSCFGKPKQAQCSYVLERAMGIEPTLFAWEARVLPLNDAREARRAGLQQGVGEVGIVAGPRAGLTSGCRPCRGISSRGTRPCRGVSPRGPGRIV